MSAVRFLQQENARLKEQLETLQDENLALRHYIDALEKLHLATQQIMSEENLFNLLDQILFNAMEVVGAENGSLLIRDEETGELAFVLVHGDIQQKLKGYRMDGKVGIAGWVATHRESLIVDNAHQDSRFSSQVDETFNFYTRSILCAPMVANDKVIGVIQLINKKNGHQFIETDLALVSVLGHIAATALETINARLEAEEIATNATVSV